MKITSRYLITFKDIIKVKQHPNDLADQFGRLRVAAAVGVAKDTFDRINALKMWS